MLYICLSIKFIVNNNSGRFKNYESLYLKKINNDEQQHLCRFFLQ